MGRHMWTRCVAALLAVSACGGTSPTSGDGGHGSDGPSGSGTPITVTLDAVPGDRSFYSYIAAYQDGDGAWQLAPPPENNVYTFKVNGPTWGFAYTCAVIVVTGGVATSLRDVVERHFTLSERTTAMISLPPRCTDQGMYVALSGNIANRVTGGGYIVTFNSRSVFADAMGNYTLLVPTGTHDLIAMHGINGGTAGDFIADSAFVQRNVAVNAASTQNINAQQMAGVQSFGVTVNGAASEEDAVTVLYSAGGTPATLVNLSKAPLKSEALAAGQAAAGDVYDQKINVAAIASQPITTTTATATPAAQTFMGGTPLGAASVMSASAMPYPIFKTTWAAYPNAIGYTLSLNQTPPAAGCLGSSACNITWTVVLSPGAVGASPAYTMPDLSMLTGWNKQIQFVPGTIVKGEVTAMTSSAGPMDFPAGQPAVGTTRLFAHAVFNITP